MQFTLRVTFDSTEFANTPHPKADLVLENYGREDVWKVRYGNPANFPQSLRTIRATYPTTPILWVTPVPVRYTNTDYGDPQLYNDMQNQIVPTVKAMGETTVDLNAFILSQPNWQDLLTDGLDPSQAFYEQIAKDLLWPAIQKATACR